MLGVCAGLWFEGVVGRLAGGLASSKPKWWAAESVDSLF